MRADPVTGHEILFQANSLENNILATLCPGEDVDFTVDVTVCFIRRCSRYFWNYRVAWAAYTRNIQFIPVVADYSITAKMFCVFIILCRTN